MFVPIGDDALNFDQYHVPSILPHVGSEQKCVVSNRQSHDDSLNYVRNKDRGMGI